VRLPRSAARRLRRGGARVERVDELGDGGRAGAALEPRPLRRRRLAPAQLGAPVADGAAQRGERPRRRRPCTCAELQDDGARAARVLVEESAQADGARARDRQRAAERRAQQRARRVNRRAEPTQPSPPLHEHAPLPAQPHKLAPEVPRHRRSLLLRVRHPLGCRGYRRVEQCVAQLRVEWREDRAAARRVVVAFVAVAGALAAAAAVRFCQLPRAERAQPASAAAERLLKIAERLSGACQCRVRPSEAQAALRAWRRRSCPASSRFVAGVQLAQKCAPDGRTRDRHEQTSRVCRAAARPVRPQRLLARCGSCATLAALRAAPLGELDSHIV